MTNFYFGLFSVLIDINVCFIVLIKIDFFINYHRTKFISFDFILSWRILIPVIGILVILRDPEH